MSRLYYQDAYTNNFTAVITERVAENGRFAIILNETYFYPTSGGQPFDQGTINGVPVIDVTIREQDGPILHWLAGHWPKDESVTAVIDWPRRFDHMQQHTGQHILSQAFIRVAEAETIGFHLSDDTVTIDLAIDQLSPIQIEQVEQLANQIVWENRPVHIQSVTHEAALKLPLRKIPPAQTGNIRLIDIEEFDLTACGGTHVAQTGGVGLIKIVKLERRRGNIRVEFRCGSRALADYNSKNETIQSLMATLTTGQEALGTAVTTLQEDNKISRRTIKKQRQILQEAAAVQLLHQGQKIDNLTIINHVFNETENVNLRQYGNQLIQNSGVIALLATSGAKSQLCFCRAKDAAGDMNALLQDALLQIGQGKGGGNELMAQGGGQGVEHGRLAQILQNILQNLIPE